MLFQVPPAIIEQAPVSYQGTGIVVGTKADSIDKARLRAELEVYGKFGVSISSRIEENRKTTQSTGFFSRFKDKDELNQSLGSSVDLQDVPGCSILSAKQENGLTTVRVELTQSAIDNFFRMHLQKLQNETTASAASLKVNLFPTKEEKKHCEAKKEAYSRAISKAKQFGVHPSICKKHMETLLRVETLLRAITAI
jgi:hypothetical protein